MTREERRLLLMLLDANTRLLDAARLRQDLDGIQRLEHRLATVRQMLEGRTPAGRRGRKRQ